MTRTEFEKYLGKDVTITLYDGAIYAGILHQTAKKLLRTILIYQCR